MQRATDLGRTAWHAGANVEGTAATLRTVKGILNKLTPEKFERLLSQFIPLVSNYEVLQQTIRLVFEAAVQQPTFVAMYADLCRELDAVLPEFEEPETGRITSFRKMLANTCQEEYEGAGALRERSAALPLGSVEREESERAAKQRLLGNIRLIAELFNKGLVNDRIMLLILLDLLGEGEPPVESIEAVCELLTTAGGALERNEKAKPRLDAAFTTLQRLAGNTRLYPSRVRFLIRDVVELRTQRWVPRREAFTAKKLEDVRAEAAAELGLDVTIPGLDGNALGALGALTAPLAPKRPEELELFPAFRSDDAGWAVAASQGRSAAPDGRFSAFLGDYVAVQSSAPVAAPSTAGTAPRFVGFLLASLVARVSLIHAAFLAGQTILVTDWVYRLRRLTLWERKGGRGMLCGPVLSGLLGILAEAAQTLPHGFIMIRRLENILITFGRAIEEQYRLLGLMSNCYTH